MRTDPLDLNPDFPGDYLRYLSTFTKSEAFLLNLFSSKQFNLVYPLPDLSTSIVLTVHINQLMSQMVRTYHLYVYGGEKTIYQCRIVHIMRVIS